MTIKEHFITRRRKPYRLKTTEPGFKTLSELISSLPSSLSRGAAHLFAFLHCLDPEHCFVSIPLPKIKEEEKPRLIYLNKNNLGSWELYLYQFVQSVRLKTLVVYENSWLERLMPNSPKIVRFDSKMVSDDEKHVLGIRNDV